MKRKIWIASLAALCILLSACGGAALTKNDLSVSVRGTKITTGTAVDELLTAFGEPESQSEAVSCVYSGMDKTYSYSDFTVYSYTEDDCEYFSELYCTENVQTEKGVSIGSSEDAVRKAYGEGLTEGCRISYSLEKGTDTQIPDTLYFEIEEGKVCAIGLICAHRAE